MFWEFGFCLLCVWVILVFWFIELVFNWFVWLLLGVVIRWNVGVKVVWVDVCLLWDDYNVVINVYFFFDLSVFDFYG